MIFETIAVGPLQCNCYVLGCEATREGVILDPGDESDLILPLVEKHQLKIKYIISTHAHIDHVGDLETVKNRTGAEAILHEQDLPLYRNLSVQAAWLGMAVPPSAHIDTFIHNRDVLRFGGYTGEVVYTPGHTPGSLCLLVPEAIPRLFAGDTLFQQSVGRTDLWGGSYEKLMKSIREKLLVLDDSTVVHPGHGPATTIGEERKHNPFLQELQGRSFRL